ncbi:hypothetical protein Ahy_A08g038678 [Arachis hypogaea]|uniref:Aminotransferase-like plant mobile domain-containing protein n=1 Tax=Arachis hypogaea TaxID=3818 RepID=A0A445BU33_ARAHY|nr:hypothetical protein Ahy_A08g038678 [Arachis hypogaea]
MAVFGREPVVSGNSKSYIKLGWVRRIKDAEPLDTEESIRRYVRCQIFCLLGSTLFTDKSTAYAHAKYLPLLRDFERIHTYSWGLACLAHFYRALCRASRYDTKEMDDPLNLLFVWAWERMPCLAPVPRHTLPPAEIPVAMRWSHSERTTSWLAKTVANFRVDIDYMQEFEWRPYEGMIIPNELHGHLDVCDTVAPLLSFECIEWHPADQVMRQFGFAQPPPQGARGIPLDQHCLALRGVQQHDWTVLHGPWIVEWGNMRNTRLRDLHPLPTWDFIPSTEYRDWYVRSFGHMLRLSEYSPPERFTAARIDSCRSEIIPTPSFLTTCIRRFLRKKCHASAVSPSTKAKAIGTIFWFPSCATATISVPLYLPYRCVPST